MTENGWTTTSDTEWTEEAFPAEVKEVITRDEDDYGSGVARMEMIMVVVWKVVMTRTTTMYFEA